MLGYPNQRSADRWIQRLHGGSGCRSRKRFYWALWPASPSSLASRWAAPDHGQPRARGSRDVRGRSCSPFCSRTSSSTPWHRRGAGGGLRGGRARHRRGDRSIALLGAGFVAGTAGLATLERWSRPPGPTHPPVAGGSIDALTVDDAERLDAQAKGAHRRALQVGLTIAAAIGLHNFAEGLAIGVSASTGRSRSRPSSSLGSRFTTPPRDSPSSVRSARCGPRGAGSGSPG